MRLTLPISSVSREGVPPGLDDKLNVGVATRDPSRETVTASSSFSFITIFTSRFVIICGEECYPSGPAGLFLRFYWENARGDRVTRVGAVFSVLSVRAYPGLFFSLIPRTWETFPTFRCLRFSRCSRWVPSSVIRAAATARQARTARGYPGETGTVSNWRSEAPPSRRPRRLTLEYHFFACLGPWFRGNFFFDTHNRTAIWDDVPANGYVTLRLIPMYV